MDAYEIIEYIRTSEKKTPVKVYVWEKEPVSLVWILGYNGIIFVHQMQAGN